MEATATMLLATGAGLIVGSLSVSLVSLALSRVTNTGARPVAPLGGIGMALGLVGAGLFPRRAAGGTAPSRSSASPADSTWCR